MEHNWARPTNHSTRKPQTMFIVKAACGMQTDSTMHKFLWNLPPIASYFVRTRSPHIMPLYHSGAHCKYGARQFCVLSNTTQRNKWILFVLHSKNLVLHSYLVKGSTVKMSVQLWDNYHQVSKHDRDLVKCRLKKCNELPHFNAYSSWWYFTRS